MHEDLCVLRDMVAHRLEHFIHKLQESEDEHTLEPILDALIKVAVAAKEQFHCSFCENKKEG